MDRGLVRRAAPDLGQPVVGGTDRALAPFHGDIHQRTSPVWIAVDRGTAATRSPQVRIVSQPSG